MKIRLLQAQASTGAREIVQGLRERGHNALRTKVQGSTYRGIGSHLIVNWGRSEYPYRWNTGVVALNKPEAVALACNKLTTFETLTRGGIENNLPSWTSSKDTARAWTDVGKVYCRVLTRGSKGRGIVVAHSPEEVVDARLYTAGVDVDREVRVHVFKGEVIDYAQKKKLNSESREERGLTGEPDSDIRNLQTGWIFARGGVSIPDSTKEICKRAVELLGLDFGAVDAVINEQGVTKILEINTAPGVEGTTLVSYLNAIEECL